MKIGDLSKLTQTQVETIRYYEREGLLPEPDRTEGNYRIYGEAHAERLAFIRHCRSLDMALDEIRQLLRFKDDPASDCGDVNALLDEHIGHVSRRIKELKSLERDARSLTEYDAQLAAEIAFLLDATLGLIDIEQNRIIKVFSIAAVLFLPPTLVGTVYGMNFEHMPELRWAFGYPFALLMMVASAIAPYYWFKHRGWL